jgi:acyl-CoA thioesterase
MMRTFAKKLASLLLQSIPRAHLRHRSKACLSLLEETIMYWRKGLTNKWLLHAPRNKRAGKGKTGFGKRRLGERSPREDQSYSL